MSRESIILLSFLSLFSYNEAGGQPPGGGGAVFNVMDFGATHSKEDESSQAFIQAWNAACHSQGKATMLVPPGFFLLGETVFQGPCQNPVTILVQGTLQAVADMSLYSGEGWISLEDIDGLTLTGGGTFDGQGQAVWKYNDCQGSSSSCARLPASIHMMKVNRTMIQQVNMVNSMGFHMHITRCEEVRIQKLAVTAPGDSPNTDGIHISKSRAVKVSMSVFRTGDDCISVGQGANNVTINQITCGPGHGISVGSLGRLPNELDVRGLQVKNCTLVGTTNGLRIKTYPASGPSAAAGILFEDIVLENVENPIIIDQNYGSKSTEVCMYLDS
ncbi:exopolygalacturonase-like [Andrographis paniculata]|uniref:exopolygalacturonase-like n=1 Tax=Andrographis paniculata TaxID=175694 RepID=UPI0021E763F3|nr:exopolygalacturonase-like [Andrographis paniculata]